jgi:hypothetical protein
VRKAHTHGPAHRHGLQSRWHRVPAALRGRNAERRKQNGRGSDASCRRGDQTRVRSCGLPTKRARARRDSRTGGAEVSEGDVYGIGGLLLCHLRWSQSIPKANRRIIGNPPCHVNGDVAVWWGPGSAGCQPAAAGETPALPGHWRSIDATDIERSVVLQRYTS